jgi:hypothetical protein
MNDRMTLIIFDVQTAQGVLREAGGFVARVSNQII